MQQQHVLFGAASSSSEAQPLQLLAVTSLRERFRRLDGDSNGLLTEQEITALLVESGMESVGLALLRLPAHNPCVILRTALAIH
jgi:hypothetical protein